MPLNSVEFGWGAAPMKEQHPCLPDDVAGHFDEDNKAMIRLSVRGVISTTERRNAMKRLTRLIEKEIRKSLRPESNNRRSRKP